MKWRSETWQQRGDGFLIEIKRWQDERRDVDTDELRTINHWNVYAYIYPKHPLFEEIEDAGLFLQHPIREFFHCGLSRHSWNRNKDGNISSKELGSDYQHLHDNYEYCTNIGSTPTEQDAERLFEYLAKASVKKPEPVEVKA